MDPGRGLKKSWLPGSKSRWQVVHFIFCGTGVLQDWEYGNSDVSDCPVLNSVHGLPADLRMKSSRSSTASYVRWSVILPEVLEWKRGLAIWHSLNRLTGGPGDLSDVPRPCCHQSGGEYLPWTPVVEEVLQTLEDDEAHCTGGKLLHQTVAPCVPGSHRRPKPEDNHMAGPARHEPSPTPVQRHAIAHHQQDLCGEKQPDGDGDGMKTYHRSGRRRFVEESRQVYAKTGNDSEPNQSEPYQRRDPVLARARGGPRMPFES